MSDDRFIEIIDEIERPFVTTSDLSNHVEMSNDGIRRRLNQLEESGKLERKKVGARAVVWWLDGD